MPRPKLHRRVTRPPRPDTYTREGSETRVRRRTRLYELSLWMRKNYGVDLASVIDSPREMNFYLEVYGKYLYYEEHTLGVFTEIINAITNVSMLLKR